MNESNKSLQREMYVSRAGFKLASVADKLNLDFKGKVVLDVGSSTGGFTDYALQHGAKKVIAVEIGTNQLHPSLRGHPNIELHEKTDIRDYARAFVKGPTSHIDLVVIDVSFTSLTTILPSVARLCSAKTQVVAMAKPQFEAGDELKHKGIIKNDKIRRNILKNLESWMQKLFIIQAKADSAVHGAKGNEERFYLLKLIGSF